MYIGVSTLRSLFRTFQQFVLFPVFKKYIECQRGLFHRIVDEHERLSLKACLPRTSTFTRLTTFVPFDRLLHLLSENRPRFCVTVVNDSTKCISFEIYFPFCLSFETVVSNTVSLRPRLDVNGV